MSLLRTLWKKKIWMLLATVAVGGVVVALNYEPPVESPYETETVAFRSIVQEVSVTGSIKPTAELTLRFPISGTVDSVRVEEGDLVDLGQELIRLEDDDLDLAITTAQADVANAEAEYAKASAGSSAESIAVAKAAVKKAEADLAQAESSLENQEQLGDQAIAIAELDYASAVSDYEQLDESLAQDVEHAYESALIAIDDALTAGEEAFIELDNILSVEHDTNDPSLLSAISAHSSSRYTSAVNAYKDLNNTYDDVAEELIALESRNNDEVQSALDTTTDLLYDITDLIDDVDDLVSDAPVVQGFDETKRQSVRSDLSAQKSALLTQRSELLTEGQSLDSVLTDQTTQLTSAQFAIDQAEQAIAQAELEKSTALTTAEASIDVYTSILTQAEASLAEVEAGPRDVDLEPYRAAIDRAEAQLALALYNRTRSSIESPIDGIVTEVYAERGESVSTADDMIKIISTTSTIWANIPESDISKIALGNSVRMTLDAFAFDEIFEGKIVEIDPAETVVDGVIYYQVKAEFVVAYPGVKSGMTANMDIVTAEESEVLAIPLRALKYDEDRIYVEVLDAETGLPREVEVKLGVKDDQYVQILEGLEEGDEVITVTRETL